MKFTLSWLKDHLETDASLDEISNRLTSLGLEVESILNPAAALRGFVVADVLEAGRHPNADRLSLCFADPGTGERVQVVCGAPNVRPGMKVAFAPLGSLIPTTQTILKKGKIRDCESNGMFCSAKELGLGEDADGIMDLQTALPAGTPLVEVLTDLDPVIDISITPNRSDCFGVRGIARDLAASGLGRLKDFPYADIKEALGGDFPLTAGVTKFIEDWEGCHDYHFRYIKGVHNAASPEWVQKRLEAIGQRSLSGLVDVTNYLCIDFGRPLHVFDAAKIKGYLKVRAALPGEKLTALNGITYDLQESMTIIADETGPLALGGIMGGLSSACTPETTDVVVECALFDPINIAKTGRALNILSESRTRFERGINSESVYQGLQAAADLIISWCGGKAGPITGESLTPQPKIQIIFSLNDFEKRCGFSLTQDEAISYFTALGMEIEGKETNFTVKIPRWRPDITIPEDLVEELLRLKGYDHIPSVPLPLSSRVDTPPSQTQMAKRLLASRGFNETVTWSFMESSLAESFSEEHNKPLGLENPISAELGALRPSILGNLVNAAQKNHDRAQDTVTLFEVGPIFDKESQTLTISGLCSGFKGGRHWAQAPRSFDVFDVKADVMALLMTLGFKSAAFQIMPHGPSFYHPGRVGTVKQGQKIVAHFGEIHPAILKKMAVKGPQVGFEIFLETLPSAQSKKTALILSPYQPITRDFAFVLSLDISAGQLIQTIEKIDRDLIRQVNVFDVYRGDHLPADKKSLAVQVRLEPADRTFTEADIQQLSSLIIETVKKNLGGELRTA